MASWTVTANLQNNGQLALNSTDHIWMNGSSFGLNVVAGYFQNSTHVTDQNDNQRDTISSVNNTMYLTPTTYSLNGGASLNLNTISGTQAPFTFTFNSGGPTVSLSNAKFFAYDGVNTANQMANVQFFAAEANSSNGTYGTWTNANGIGNALNLTTASNITSYNYYIAMSASPTAPGAISGGLQLQLTYA